MRIDKINNNINNKKKSQETTTPPRRAFEAEEKLKKLAEQADLAKKMVSASSKETSPAKSSQVKAEETKKSSKIQGVVTRKRIQLVLQKVKNVQKKNLLNTQKRTLLLVGKKQPLKSTKTLSKVVSTKVGFQRHLKKNVSQRQTTNTKVLDTKMKNIKGKVIFNNNNNISKTENVKNKSPSRLQETRAETNKGKSANGSNNNLLKAGKLFFFQCIVNSNFPFSSKHVYTVYNFD